MLNQPVFLVDFNELVEPQVVLLSATDQREDQGGRMITLVEGMRVLVWDQDVNELGERDDLIAAGTVARIEAGAGGWPKNAMWSCLIDERGIRHRSDGLHADEL